jgi:hypothetical protein
MRFSPIAQVGEGGVPRSRAGGIGSRPNQPGKRPMAAVACLVMCLAWLSDAGIVLAQEPACSLHKVNARLLNVSKDPGGDVYIDVLENGEIACVTRRQRLDGRDLGYVSHTLGSSAGPTPVNGWAAMRFMKELTPAEAAAVAAGTPPAAAPPPAVAAAPPAAVPPAAAAPSVAAAPPPPVAAAPPATAVPPAAAAPAPAVAAAPAAGTAPPGAAGPTESALAVPAEDVSRFDQPIPFGPYPVNGRSIAELILTVPLFPPIEGLDEALWKKECKTCHKWDQARLCEQGKTYAKSPKSALRQPHPFGSAEKLALMRWAKAGCQ